MCMYIDNASQVYLYGVNSYHGSEGGVYLGANCNGIYVSGGSFDRNDKCGLYIEKQYEGTWAGSRFFAGVRFLGNSKAVTNTYSDVYVNGASTDVVFTNCDWQGEAGTGTKPKYYIEFSSINAKVRLVGCKLDATGYETDLTNSWASVQSDDLNGFVYQMLSASQLALKAGSYDDFQKGVGRRGVEKFRCPDQHDLVSAFERH